jgi:hypothetical protein
MAPIGENDWPMWIITGRLKGAAASYARRSPRDRWSRHVVRQSRLDANHDIAMTGDGSARQTDNGTIDIHQLAIWGIAGTRLRHRP